jgi:hypothetical protein
MGHNSNSPCQYQLLIVWTGNCWVNSTSRRKNAVDQSSVPLEMGRRGECGEGSRQHQRWRRRPRGQRRREFGRSSSRTVRPAEPFLLRCSITPVPGVTSLLAYGCRDRQQSRAEAAPLHLRHRSLHPRRCLSIRGGAAEDSSVAGVDSLSNQHRLQVVCQLSSMLRDFFLRLVKVHVYRIVNIKLFL